MDEVALPEAAREEVYKFYPNAKVANVGERLTLCLMRLRVLTLQVAMLKTGG